MMCLPSESSNQNFVSLFRTSCVLHAPPISPSLKVFAEQHDSHSSFGGVAAFQSNAEGASRLGCDAVRLVADVSKDRSRIDMT